jgi:hypothetical protein
MRIINKLRKYFRFLTSLEMRLNGIQEALGRIEKRQAENLNLTNASEFKVYSQWGEDGIIQKLIESIELTAQIFIEFGVETYTESNTRFLLVNNNWSGLVIDGDQKNINFIKSDPIYWKYNLKADCAFITCENINQLIVRNGLSGDIGLLSVDIDGNDYWVWNAIDTINPCIVVCEYNSLWGFNDAVSTPYDAGFIRSYKHHSNLYYGASIKALNDLAIAKGYTLVSGNSSGNNVFFVRNDLLGNLKAVDIQDAWVQSQFRESRDQKGELTYLDFDKRRALVSDMPLIDVRTGQVIKVRDLK